MNKFIILSAISLSLFRPYGAEDCSSDYYYKPRQGRCVQCPPCGPGTERTSNCGHDETGKETGPKCRPCPWGTYKDTSSTERCKQCKICEDDGKLTKRTCNMTSNAICECPRGKYLSKYSDSCLPCSYCADYNWQQSSQLELECKQQGMARCSCKVSISGSKKYREKCRNMTTTSSPSSFHTITTPGTSSVPRNKTDRSHTTSPKTTKAAIMSQKMSIWATSLPTGDDKANGGAKAQRQAKKTDEDILKDPGWIVAFSIVGASFAFVIILMWRHEHIRKKVSGFCCRNYQQLPSDRFNSVLLTVEDRQEEPPIVEPINNATPIPVWEQPVSPMISSTEGKLFHNSSNKDVENEKLQCACTLASSESSIEWLRSPFSSTEAITKDHGHSKNALTGGTQTSSGGTLSNAAPPRVASPSHHTLPGVTLTRANLHGQVTSPGVTPPRSCSPGVTLPSVTPPRTTSPTPLTLLTIAQTRSADDEETSDQSKEHSSNSLKSSKPEMFATTSKKPERNDPIGGLCLWPGGEISRFSCKGRNCSPEKEELQHTYDLYRNAKITLEETGAKKHEIIPVPASDEGSDRVVMTTGGNDIEVNGNGRMKKKSTKSSIPSRCEFRPILRDTEHRCPNCCPLPSDSFFTLIERDRRCLREEICKALNKISDTLGNYKQLAICSRVDIETPEFEAHSNPTERVLERLKAKRPSLTLEEFEEMLHKMERLDIADLIKNHHTTCLLCKRNKFD